jgi:hypothetical protein
MRCHSTAQRDLFKRLSHTPLQRLRNDAMAYLMLKAGLRTIDVSRARSIQRN